MTPELGVQIGDLLDRFADAALHEDARALCRGTGSSRPTTETDRAGDLIGQRVELVAKMLGARDVGESLGFLDGLAQIVDPAFVRPARVRIEDLAGVADVDHG